ncbi:YqzM family protein [Hazenella sp. IB182357]|uniref:YqzM family protein n=1 Tax=Polycladospora coralii TaxID=2771432 RepID=A0A926RSM0_9BACL|nr:YqzM family protein [Polycladospora coralii]MBD1371460.1 YqzM family protein [Polycladospora coralii]MBS7530428.1 YqzM family protein [Polycladospora coralii]
MAKTAKVNQQATEVQENDFLDTVVGMLVASGVFLGIFTIATVVSFFV